MRLENPMKISSQVASYLTEAQLSFFARNGFLHLEGQLSPEICSALIERTWAKLPSTWNRDDRQTWAGPVVDSCHDASVDVRLGHLKFQKGDLIGDPVVQSGFCQCSPLGTVAQQLIGAPLAPMRVRGLYCIVPTEPNSGRRRSGAAHIEAHATQLISMCYLDDVPEQSGGLLVWPGSHQEIYPTMASRLEYAAGEGHADVIESWSSLTPLEISGRRGDIVIIHHRLLHAPSVHNAEKIRFAFLSDYHRHDFRHLSELKPTRNMWEDWPAIMRLPAKLRDGPADFSLEPRGDPIPTGTSKEPRRKYYALSKDSTSADLRCKSDDHVKQNDASALARLRTPGDIWIAISDKSETFHENKLRPRGCNWDETGLTVTHNGEPMQSKCLYDFISRLSCTKGENSIGLDGLDRIAWLRIIKIKLPFDQSEVIFRSALKPGAVTLHFSID